MVDKELLLYKIKASGYTVESLSKAVGVNKSGLYKRINGKIDFLCKEALAITLALGLDQETAAKIFFNHEVA